MRFPTVQISDVSESSDLHYNVKREDFTGKVENTVTLITSLQESIEISHWRI